MKYLLNAGLINSTSVVNYKNDTITLITKEKYDEWSKYIPYLSASMGISTYNFNLGGLSGL